MYSSTSETNRRAKTPADRTTPGLQVAVMLLGLVMAVIVVVLVGRFISDTFNDVTEEFNQITCTTETSTC